MQINCFVYIQNICAGIFRFTKESKQAPPATLNTYSLAPSFPRSRRACLLSILLSTQLRQEGYLPTYLPTVVTSERSGGVIPFKFL